jgi:hypothetical protein
MGLPLESGSAGSLTLFAALWSTSKWRGSQSALHQRLGTGGQNEKMDPVVSRNSITTECADFQTLVEPVLGLISDRAYALGGPPNGRDRVDSGVSGSLDQPAGTPALGLKSDTLSFLT